MLFENLALRLLIEILERIGPDPVRRDNEAIEKAWQYIEHQTTDSENVLTASVTQPKINFCHACGTALLKGV